MGPAFAARRFTTSDGVRLNVLEAGTTNLSGPVIALVPGWCMPASLWRLQLDALGSRFRVSALDPRGQGESELPAHGYTIDRRADDIHEFVTHYDKVILVGWSLGALEALQCLHRHGAENVAALVIVDSSVGEDPPPASSTHFLEDLRSDRARAVGDFIRTMFRKAPAEAELERLCNAAMRMDIEASLSLFPAHLPREHWRRLARGCRKPLLYAVSSRFAGQAENLRKYRPATRVELFESAGHALFVDEAERFNRLLEEFVSAV